MKKETYTEAKTRLLKELATLGWTTKPNLKFPWARSSCEGYRLDFKAQAVYLNGHSLFIDIREMSVFELVRVVGS